MAEEKMTPKKIWDNALKTIKGDSTEQLVEAFTAEMTLVAEGLYDDQARIRNENEDIRREMDRSVQKLEQEIQLIERAADEGIQDSVQKVQALEKRIYVLENQCRKLEKEREEKPKITKKTIIQQITLPVAIVSGAWVLVTLIGLIRSLLS